VNVPDDDDILEAYEREFDPGEAPTERPSNRGFWLVAGTIIVACVVLVVEIFANRPLANSIGHAQFDLNAAKDAALDIKSTSGSFAGANAEGMNQARLDEGRLVAVGPDERSGGLNEISVYADETVWAAAVSARPGACFFLKLVIGQDPKYGVGTSCTGREALSSRDDRW
jgi:hypothetical protein